MTARFDHVDGRSAQFVQLLRDLGHTDDELEARILFGAPAGSRPDDAHGEVDLATMRRAAAMELFERHDGVVDGLLAEDWSLLFS